MGVVTKADISSTMMKLPSAALRRTAGNWVFSQDIPSDITVIVSGVAYALHKFPLVSRSGWIRRIVSESQDSDLSKIELPDLPGGSEAFEYAAKFCYGINFEIDTKNVAALRCAAEYLDMSEDYADENLAARTETFLTEVVMNSLPSCVTVLQTCESLMPLADKLDIVSRCADAAALKACGEQMTPSLSRSDLSSSGRMDAHGSPGNYSQTPKRRSVEWWVEEISVLRIENFKRIVVAMKARGVRGDSLGSAIVYYTQRWLRSLLKKQAGQLVEMRQRAKQMKDVTVAAEQEQLRALVETLVDLMPLEKNMCSVSFLCALLRVANYLEVNASCRLEIEKRIGWQLEQAAVDDLLIPSFAHHADTYVNLDCISRIVGNFLQQEGQSRERNGEEALASYEYSSDGGGTSPPPQSAVMKAARVLDSLLAEVAPDANLSVTTFIGFAELMPDYARVVDDGLYRAIDIYLKAHPGVNEIERKKVAGLMDCQKLSQEACTHAAQNERLPVQVVVQVLYFEQMRLRNASSNAKNANSSANMSPAKTNSGLILEHAAAAAQRRLMGSGRPTSEPTPRMRAKQLQLSGDTLGFEDAVLPPAYPSQNVVDYNRQAGSAVVPPAQTLPAGGPVPVAGYIKQDAERPKSRFFQSVSNALSRLNPFHRVSSSNEGGLKPPSTPDIRSRRPRRHSIS